MEDFPKRSYAIRPKTHTQENGSASTAAAGKPKGFNHLEAARLFHDRWTMTVAKMSDASIPPKDRPQAHKSVRTGSVWGKSNLHLQASVGDFLGELRKALAASEGK